MPQKVICFNLFPPKSTNLVKPIDKLIVMMYTYKGFRKKPKEMWLNIADSVEFLLKKSQLV